MLMGRLQSQGLCLNITAAKTVWGDLEPVPFLKCESPISFRWEVLALLLTLKNTCFQNPASVVLSSKFCRLLFFGHQQGIFIHKPSTKAEGLVQPLQWSPFRV